MGGAIAADGSMEMQCQSCHGNMSQVGSTNRVGWFMEPACQSCHTGTATSNNGQIRYTSVFTDTNFTVRTNVDPTFATTSDTPAPGLSLYRFSVGHGGLQCSACHGSTHAEFPSTHRNDNLRNIALQGHAGVMTECVACHPTVPSTINGGPHGMHPVGQTWVSQHPAIANTNRTQCRLCHGSDYRGTVLSRMQADRTLSAFGTKTFFRGAIIGCYACHQGPGDDLSNTNNPPSVANISVTTPNDTPVNMTLPLTGAGTFSLQIISQPTNGAVGLNTNTGVATYFPNSGSIGTDVFTFAAYDGSKNSSLATGTVVVAQGPYLLGATAHVPPNYPAKWPVAFAVVPGVTNSAVPVSFDWNFGDGSTDSTNQYATHAYSQPGTYIWTVTSTISGASAVNSGSITIGNPIVLNLRRAVNGATVSWPATIADSLLEQSGALASSAQWSWVTNTPATNFVGPGTLSVNLPVAGNQFFRVRQAW
jgi:hypothetical protein